MMLRMPEITLPEGGKIRSEEIDLAYFTEKGAGIGSAFAGEPQIQSGDDELRIVMKDAADKRPAITGQEARRISMLRVGMRPTSDPRSRLV
jgi:hypothetical protein